MTEELRILNMVLSITAATAYFVWGNGRWSDSDTAEKVRMFGGWLLIIGGGVHAAHSYVMESNFNGGAPLFTAGYLALLVSIWKGRATA